MQRDSQSAGGFTLVEILFVIVVTGILLTIAMIRFDPSITDKVIAQAASRKISGSLFSARRLSISTDRVHYFELRPSGGPNYTEFQIFRIDDDGTISPIETPIIFDSKINCVSANDSFSFTPSGSASKTGTIEIRCGGIIYYVKIYANTGMIVVEKG